MPSELPVLKVQSPDRFQSRLTLGAAQPLRSTTISTLQVNLGKRCNQACHHCHVDAGPQRTEEMSLETIQLILGILRRHSIETLDITGGAPEINPHFRTLVTQSAGLCGRIVDRSNLTIFFEAGHEDLPQFLADHQVEVTASLPCYEMSNVDEQRGTGVFKKSIAALQLLNRLGYAEPDSGLILNLVYNPVGPYLPPPQERLQADYQRELADRFGIRFNQLFTITNMPISRFRHELQRSEKLAEYMQLLESAYNPQTVQGLMCRSYISVSWDGFLYDCDFNQMLDMKVNHGAPQHVRNFDYYLLSRRVIRTDEHCFGCTAGAGSSCAGAVVS